MFNRKYSLLLVFYFTYCNAEIKINLSVASSRGGVIINFEGSDDKLITNKEINIFNLTDVSLKHGFRVELGKAPDDVFLKDPTYYGNLYQKYEWREVNRRLIAKNVVINDIINENVALIIHNHINNTTMNSKIKVNMFKTMENTIKSSWSTDGLPDDKVIYKFNISYNNNLFCFNNTWRNKNLQMVHLPIGIRNEGYIDIGTGKGVTMKLSAKRTILLIKITYVASLKGQIVANYAHVYGKYHFWAPSISSIMKATKLNNELITTEFIEVKFYTDPKLDVFDMTSGEKVPIQFVKRPFRHRGLKYRKL